MSIDFNKKQLSKDKENDRFHNCKIDPAKNKKPKTVAILTTIVFFVLFFIMIFSVSYNNKKYDLVVNNDKKIVQDDDEDVSKIDNVTDTDNDGLPDYVEVFLGTSIEDSDTDNDDFSDFEEIKNGYSPLNDKKYTEEEWDNVKKNIRLRDYSFFVKAFIEDSTCEYKKGEYELRYYDSEGRVAGEINGEIINKIPNFEFNEQNFQMIPEDINTYEIFCIKSGSYVLNLFSSDDGEDVIPFSAVNIPIFSGETHRYKLHSDPASGDSNNNVLLIDTDSDGEFEREVDIDSELNCEDFISKNVIIVN